MFNKVEGGGTSTYERPFINFPLINISINFLVHSQMLFTRSYLFIYLSNPSTNDSS